MGWGVRDPEKKLIPDPDPGVKKTTDPIPDPQHCLYITSFTRNLLISMKN
jgi:hypothetical protein